MIESPGHSRGRLLVVYARLRETALEERLMMKSSRRAPRDHGSSTEVDFAVLTTDAMNFDLPVILVCLGSARVVSLLRTI